MLFPQSQALSSQEGELTLYVPEKVDILGEMSFAETNLISHETEQLSVPAQIQEL